MDDSEGKIITGLRDASFSCYLTTPAEVNNFAAKLTEPAETHMIKPPESEIGVFRAEKYFNMRLEDARSPRIIDTITGKYVKERNKKSSHVVRIPSTVRSEASWSSQSALLRRRSSPPPRKSFFFLHGLSCRGSCSDKKSIQNINTTYSRDVQGAEVAHNAVKWEAARKVQSASSRFQQPIGILQGKKASLGEEEGRKSLEVFGSESMKKEDDTIAVELQRKLSVLTWDAIPIPIPISNQQQEATKVDDSLQDDVASEASSDLFEIETASGSTRGQAVVFANKNSSCEGGGGYAPSEASVEWSVVTASAAAATDFSFASECGDDYNMLSATQGRKGNSVHQKGKKYNGILLSCKSHKAVDVAEAAQHKGKQFSGVSASMKSGFL